MYICERCRTTGFSEAHHAFDTHEAARMHLVVYHPYKAVRLIERLSNLLFVGAEELHRALSDEERPKS